MLHRRFDRAAAQVAEGICGDRSRSEEAVQEAFLTIWKSSTQYRAELGTVKSWALAVVRHRAIDSYRAAAIRPGLSLVPPNPDSSATGSARAAEEEAFARIEGARLRGALARLPTAQAEAIFLAFFVGLSYSEVGRYLGVPTGTIKGRIRLGLIKLAADLGPRSSSWERSD